MMDFELGGLQHFTPAPKGQILVKKNKGFGDTSITIGR